jgi:CubicO group peptidase (beta-lactamase class C family)
VIRWYRKEENKRGMNMVVLLEGKEVYSYGDVKDTSFHIASCRKAILAILYGMYGIDIRKTLNELGIDDIEGLSELEKSATIRDLLMCRSGVYHPAATNDNTLKPVRHSKRPGELFVYNSWDANVLGTIFTMETGLCIDEALHELGVMIGFEDYHLYQNRRKLHVKTNKPSRHWSYSMYLSVRDMAKVGQLMLQCGEWDGRQVVPREWIQEMVEHHDVFGYMWWTFNRPSSKDVLYGSYVSKGYGGQMIWVIPSLKLVIATKYRENSN